MPSTSFTAREKVAAATILHGLCSILCMTVLLGVSWYFRRNPLSPQSRPQKPKPPSSPSSPSNNDAGTAPTPRKDDGRAAAGDKKEGLDDMMLVIVSLTAAAALGGAIVFTILFWDAYGVLAPKQARARLMSWLVGVAAFVPLSMGTRRWDRSPLEWLVGAYLAGIVGFAVEVRWQTWQGMVERLAASNY